MRLKYYLIAPLQQNLAPLAYKSEHELHIGQIAHITILQKSRFGVVIKECEKPQFECKEATPSVESFNEYQMCLANFMAYYYCANLGVVYNIFTPAKVSDSQAADSALPQMQSITPSTLSNKQNLALDFIKSRGKTLLFGDTGSGKTEIYINAIIDTLKRGKNVIFLLPEIALTPQMEQRMIDIFGDFVCVWHSKVSKAKKAKLLSRIHTFKIIIGARSSLFLPIENLGLIIVDEEHDDAYKSQTEPRYNARDCAIYLATKCDIKLILGSATPSVVSYYNFSKSSDVFRLKGRHFESKKTLRFDCAPTGITPQIISSITSALQNRKQVIVFVPIRANFKTILCHSCGEAIMCKNCSISLSCHEKQNALVCHYCGWSMGIPKACPHCGAESLRALKMGTQEVAKELQENFREAHIGIFDRDEVTSDNKLKKILRDFKNGDIDILVGTQMISKGHDYYNVALVVILGIDGVLYGNDFRAHERAVSLVYQIAGRCARKHDGEVLIQTLNKEFFKRFCNDYEDFLRYELQNRSGFYPPFCRLALVCVQHKNDNTAKERLETCKKIVESNPNIEIIGALRAPIERINKLWRYFMLLRASSPKTLVACLHTIKNHDVIIDIDPLQLL